MGERQASWHLLTGEYPPQHGGVADYTYLVAAALARHGAEVHVWSPLVAGEAPKLAGVVLHRVPSGWSRAGRAFASQAMDALPAPRRLVVQHVPHVWGCRGMNLGFCRWLSSRRRAGDDVWTMFHEGYYPFLRHDPPRRWVLAAAQRVMTRDVLRASSRIYLSMPYWEPLLRPFEPGPRRPMTCLPVPSNVPRINDPDGVADVANRIGRGRAIIGNFGSYGRDFRDLLQRLLPLLLEGRDDRVGLLIGRGGDDFATGMIAAHPWLEGRLIATGGLPAAGISRHLQACDVMLQPYEQGVSSRRGSVMACLEHGRATATTFGRVTEPLWRESGCVAGVEVTHLADLPGVVERLLADPEARALLAARACAVYDDRFTVSRTVEVLLQDAAAASRPVARGNSCVERDVEIGIALK